MLDEVKQEADTFKLAGCAIVVIAQGSVRKQRCVVIGEDRITHAQGVDAIDAIVRTSVSVYRKSQWEFAYPDRQPRARHCDAERVSGVGQGAREALRPCEHAGGRHAVSIPCAAGTVASQQRTRVSSWVSACLFPGCSCANRDSSRAIRCADWQPGNFPGIESLTAMRARFPVRE